MKRIPSLDYDPVFDIDSYRLPVTRRRSLQWIEQLYCKGISHGKIDHCQILSNLTISRSNPILLPWHCYANNHACMSCLAASDTAAFTSITLICAGSCCHGTAWKLHSLSCPVPLFIFPFSITLPYIFANPFEQLRSEAKRSWWCLRLLLRSLHYVTWLFWYKTGPRSVEEHCH